jgi:hypothetical protein
MKINTIKPWFGERHNVFMPISWQGWLITLILILILIIDVVYLYNSTLYFNDFKLFDIILFVVIICYFLVSLLTSEYHLLDKEEEGFLYI